MKRHIQLCMVSNVCDEYTVPNVFLLVTSYIEGREYLKVPKREIFVTELFILSDSIWVGDLAHEAKKFICVKG
jgi:hypothetical protein